MIETFKIIILFIMGIYFGSFFTLATYRLPKKENITYKHSYCPNCKHKLGILDLIPVFSYIFLGGKCRYCKHEIGSRYFLFEILTGIVFVLFGLSINFNIYTLKLDTIIYFILGILYFSSLFIIAGIDKENNKIEKSVLFYGVFVSICYMIYSYTLKQENVYAYVIYLSMMISLLVLDTISLRKHLKYNYKIQFLILTLYMLIFSGPYITIATIIFTILAIGIQNILIYIKNRKSVKIKSKLTKKPVAFFMCATNIITIIVINFLTNYIVNL